MFIVISENISEYISKNFGDISSLLIFRSNELKKYLSENNITNDYKQYSQIVYYPQEITKFKNT